MRSLILSQYAQSYIITAYIKEIFGRVYVFCIQTFFINVVDSYCSY